MNQAKHKKLSITDPKMTRFNITLQEGVNMVLFAKEVNGKARLNAVYSYASGEKVYGR